MKRAGKRKAVPRARVPATARVQAKKPWVPLRTHERIWEDVGTAFKKVVSAYKSQSAPREIAALQANLDIAIARAGAIRHPANPSSEYAAPRLAHIRTNFKGHAIENNIEGLNIPGDQKEFLKLQVERVQQIVDRHHETLARKAPATHEAVGAEVVKTTWGKTLGRLFGRKKPLQVTETRPKIVRIGPRSSGGKYRKAA